MSTYSGDVLTLQHPQLATIARIKLIVHRFSDCVRFYFITAVVVVGFGFYFTIFFASFNDYVYCKAQCHPLITVFLCFEFFFYFFSYISYGTYL